MKNTGDKNPFVLQSIGVVPFVLNYLFSERSFFLHDNAFTRERSKALERCLGGKERRVERTGRARPIIEGEVLAMIGEEYKKMVEHELASGPGEPLDCGGSGVSSP